MARATGKVGEVEDAMRVIRDERGVVTTLREWRGPLSYLQTISNTLVTPWEISHDRGPIYKLVTGMPGNLAGGEPPPAPESLVVDLWNLRVTQKREDLWSHYKVRRELNKILNRESRAQFLTDIRALANGDLVLAKLVDSQGKPFYATDSAQFLTGKIAEVRLSSDQIIDYVADVWGCDRDLLQEFSSELSRGIDSFKSDTFTLVKKRVGPSEATNLLTEFEQVNLIFRTSTLLSLETTIPAAIRTPITSQLGGGFWVRESDELQQMDANRVEITSQWTYLRSYESFIYGDPV